MANIKIISNFASDYSITDNDRFLYMAKNISKDNEIEIITSDFCHEKKMHRNTAKHQWPFKITFLKEPGYKKNVCLKRLFSHYIWAKNVKKHLNKNNKPDVVYCAVPSLTSSYFAAKYCKKNKVKFIIDVQDLWPEAFQLVLNIPVIKDILFFPMKMLANYIYSNADEIVAVSETYKNRALLANKNKEKENISVFLGTEMKNFDKCAKENKVKFNDDKFRIAYVGTLGHSYDLKIIMDALNILNKKGYKDNYEFVIMGDGPLKEDFEKYAQQKEIPCNFTGRLEYKKMVGLLCSCNIAVNPIIHGAAQSIINKVGDYAMAGMPVVSTQECEEYRDLLSKYNAGFNCNNNDSQGIADSIEKLMLDKKTCDKLSKNSRKLGEELFDRNKTYKKIYDLLQ